MRILFLGTPEFAVPSLQMLVKAGYDITVVTAPDKPAGRGLQLQQPPVKKFSVQHGIKVLQPEKLKDENFLNELRSIQPDLAVVVAFRKLPEVVWGLPRMGTFNLHASLLPDYRGAAPINWAIINGEKETGVTTFFLTHEIDTGKIIFQKKVFIGENETAGELHDKLKAEGASLVLSTVQAVESGNYPVAQQPLTNNFKKAPKIFTEDCRIHWDNDADIIFNLIRGLSPYPAAFTTLNEKQLKIFSAEKIIQAHSEKPGTMAIGDKRFLRFACVNGWIEVKELQLEGKKKMKAEEFLQGYRQI